MLILMSKLAAVLYAVKLYKAKLRRVTAIEKSRDITVRVLKIV